MRGAQALRATSPPEPWLLIFGWIKFVVYTTATLDGVRALRADTT